MSVNSNNANSMGMSQSITAYFRKIRVSMICTEQGYKVSAFDIACIMGTTTRNLLTRLRNHICTEADEETLTREDLQWLLRTASLRRNSRKTEDLVFQAKVHLVAILDQVYAMYYDKLNLLKFAPLRLVNEHIRNMGEVVDVVKENITGITKEHELSLDRMLDRCEDKLTKSKSLKTKVTQTQLPLLEITKQLNQALGEVISKQEQALSVVNKTHALAMNQVAAKHKQELSRAAQMLEVGLQGTATKLAGTLNAAANKHLEDLNNTAAENKRALELFVKKYAREVAVKGMGWAEEVVAQRIQTEQANAAMQKKIDEEIRIQQKKLGNTEPAKPFVI